MTASLRYACLVGFFFVCYMVSVVTLETFNSEMCDYKANFQLLSWFDFDLKAVFTSWSILLYSFCCHPNVLDVYKEL